LLIKPTDIVVAGDTFAPLTPPQPTTNPGGVSSLFVNQGNTRSVDDSIYIYPDAGQATQARDMAVGVLCDPDLGVKGGTPTPVDVGTGGTMALGTTTQRGGPKSKGSILFTEGKAFVALDVVFPPDEPVSQDFLVDLARKQDAAIKVGLPS
jgi:hypothetical protein